MTVYGMYKKWTVADRQLTSVQLIFYTSYTVIWRNPSMGQYYLLDLPGHRQ